MPDDAGQRSDGAWSSFVTAGSASEFCAAWLAVVCGKVPGTVAGLLVLRQGEETFVPAALWPRAGLDAGHLAPTVERTLKERRGVVVRTQARAPGGAAAALPHTQVGFPVEHQGVVEGAIVLDLLQPSSCS